MASEVVEKSKDKKDSFKLIIIALLVIILSLGGIIAYFAISGKPISEVIEGMKTKEQGSLLLDEMLVNLRNENGTKNYIKISIALAYDEKKQGELIEANINRIRDIIISDLRSNTAKEILEENNNYTIKNRIKEDLNKALGKEVVKDIYFTDMVVQ